MTDHPLTKGELQSIMEEVDDDLLVTDLEVKLMRAAFDKGADHRLEQAIVWLTFELYRHTGASFDGIDCENLLRDLKKAMRPQEES